MRPPAITLPSIKTVHTTQNSLNGSLFNFFIILWHGTSAVYQLLPHKEPLFWISFFISEHNKPLHPPRLWCIRFWHQERKFLSQTVRVTFILRKLARSVFKKSLGCEKNFRYFQRGLLETCWNFFLYGWGFYWNALCLY